MEPQWAPDPFGRFTHRWWDGYQWTEHVMSGGTPMVDPPNLTHPSGGTPRGGWWGALVDVPLGRRGWRAGLAAWGAAIVAVAVTVSLAQPKPAPISTLAFPATASTRSAPATTHMTSSPTGVRTPTTSARTTAPKTVPPKTVPPKSDAARTTAPATTTSTAGTRPPTKKPVPTATKAARHFANCDAMHAVHPHGVGRPGAKDHTTRTPPVTTFLPDLALYKANSGSDRDHDGIACEQL